jgi:biopolymer transport protein ExbD
MDRHARRGVPLAPMLDIMFLLLIFFVTTSSFRAQEQQIDIQLPAAQAGKPTDPSATEIIVNIMADDSIRVGNSTYTPEALYKVMRQLVADYPDERVIIRGDRGSHTEALVRVMDVARSAGIQNIHIATVKPASAVEGN